MLAPFLAGPLPLAVALGPALEPIPTDAAVDPPLLLRDDASESARPGR